MPSVHYKIGIPLYNTEVDFYVIDDYSEIKDVYKLMWKGVCPEIGPNTVAHASWIKHHAIGSSFAMFVVDSKCTRGSIAHECLHLSYFMLEYLNIKVDSDNHEAQCYLLEFLFNKISEVSEKHKIKIK